MSKIAGINLGNPNDSFQVYGSQFGGKDGSIQIQRPTANVRRDQIDQFAKTVNAISKEIIKSIENLETLREMMNTGEDGDSVTFDKEFIKQFSDGIDKVRHDFESMFQAVSQG